MKKINEIKNEENKFIFDENNIIINYNKIHGNILNNSNADKQLDIMSGTNFFNSLTESDNYIELINKLITKNYNTDIGIFLCLLLQKHIIQKIPYLIKSEITFNKYKNFLFVLYQDISNKNQMNKFIEYLCESITIILIIGTQQFWKNGIQQLIEATKDNSINNNIDNYSKACLILGKIKNVIEKIENKLDEEEYYTIDLKLLLDDYSSEIINFINSFFIKFFKNEKKENIVNSVLFQYFLDLLGSCKYYNINIRTIEGMLEFLINCIPYLDINSNLYIYICDIFEENFIYFTSLKIDFEKYPENNIKQKLNELLNNKEFKEVTNCIYLINNMIDFYSKKELKDLINNYRDINILFSSCNIFCNICENYTYLFFIPQYDLIIQKIFIYFINLPIYKINQLILISFKSLKNIFDTPYNFDNYMNDKDSIKQNFNNNFLYFIHNIILEKIKINENNNIIINNINNKYNIDLNVLNIEKYIDQKIKNEIFDEEKINYIFNIADEFYESFYMILKSTFDINDFYNKLSKYFSNAVESNDFETVNGIMIIFNFILYLDIEDTFNIKFFLIDYIISKKSILFNNKIFILLFLRLINKIIYHISTNLSYIKIIIQNLINIFEDIEINEINSVIINKLINFSYQNYKIKRINNNENDVGDDKEKSALLDCLNSLSVKFLDILENVDNFSEVYISRMTDTIFNCCFFYISFSNLNQNKTNNVDNILNNIIYAIMTKANQIYNNFFLNNEVKSKQNYIIIYLTLITSIIYNLGKENKDILLNFLNENNNENHEYNNYKNIHLQIKKIIVNYSDSKQKEIIDYIIKFYFFLIKVLNEKNDIYFDYINEIISLIFQNAPKNLNVFELTINFYKELFIYCKDSVKTNDISKIGFDILKTMNTKLYSNSDKIFNIKNNGNISIDINTVYLCDKQCQLIILYIQHSSYFVNCLLDNKENENILDNCLSTIINVFENTNERELTINFIYMILTFLEKENKILIKFLEKYVSKLVHILINHIHYFKLNCYPTCNKNTFIIFKYLIINYRNIFIDSLEEIFDNKYIVNTIIKYLDGIKFKKYEELNLKIRILNGEFIDDIGKIKLFNRKQKKDFIIKYQNFNNVEKNNDIVL